MRHVLRLPQRYREAHDEIMTQIRPPMARAVPRHPLIHPAPIRPRLILRRLILPPKLPLAPPHAPPRARHSLRRRRRIEHKHHHAPALRVPRARRQRVILPAPHIRGPVHGRELPLVERMARDPLRICQEELSPPLFAEVIALRQRLLLRRFVRVIPRLKPMDRLLCSPSAVPVLRQRLSFVVRHPQRVEHMLRLLDVPLLLPVLPVRGPREQLLPRVRVVRQERVYRFGPPLAQLFVERRLA